jgi:hypothetical protein
MTFMKVGYRVLGLLKGEKGSLVTIKVGYSYHYKAFAKNLYAIFRNEMKCQFPSPLYPQP